MIDRLPVHLNLHASYFRAGIFSIKGDSNRIQYREGFWQMLMHYTIGKIWERFRTEEITITDLADPLHTTHTIYIPHTQAGKVRKIWQKMQERSREESGYPPHMQLISPSKAGGNIQPGTNQHYYCSPERGKLQMHPEQITMAVGRITNQREAGFPNGCTPFACAFLTLNPERDCSPEMLGALLENGRKLTIQPERNELPIEWLQSNDIGLRAVSSENPSILIREEEIGVITEGLGEELNLEELGLTDFTGEINSLLQAPIDGFIFTTTTESLAVRFRPNSFEIFDPHGDPEQRSPSCIISFPKNAAGREKIHAFLTWRAREALAGDFPQANFTPIKRIHEREDLFSYTQTD